MKRTPATKQRSVWRRTDPMTIEGVTNETALRNVGDGQLVAIFGQGPLGWHLSISHRKQNGEPGRYPRWDEIAHARDEFLPPDRSFVMKLPAADAFVSAHPTCFHLVDEGRHRGRAGGPDAGGRRPGGRLVRHGHPRRTAPRPVDRHLVEHSDPAVADPMIADAETRSLWARFEGGSIDGERWRLAGRTTYPAGVGLLDTDEVYEYAGDGLYRLVAVTPAEVAP